MTTAGARDAGLVARFELGEALRTRSLAVMLFLFVGAGALGAWGFSNAVEGIEANVAQVTGAPQTRRGGLLSAIRRSASYRGMLKTFLRSDEKADYYAARPPIVLFFGWATLVFTPWLILFTAADTIASEVSSRAIRYSALRTSRLAYAVGKALGQAIIVAGVTALSAVTFYIVAWACFDGFEHGPTALGLASLWPRVLVHSLPFLSLALFASMATSSANVARMLALGGGVALQIVSGLATSTKWRGRSDLGDTLLDLLTYLTPFGHREGFFFPPGGALVTDVAICLALTVIYFAGGFAILRRRDL